MQRNSKEIELFGENLKLHERNAKDVLSFFDMVENQNITQDASGFTLSIYNAAVIVSKALHLNLKQVPAPPKFYHIRKWFEQRRILKSIEAFNERLEAKYLINNLSHLQLLSLANSVAVLEGFDTSQNGETPKKKAKQSKSPEKLVKP